MDEKFRIIQLLIDTEDPAILKKVRALLENPPSQADDNYEVSEVIPDETVEMNDDPIPGKTTWGGWKELKNIINRKYGQ